MRLSAASFLRLIAGKSVIPCPLATNSTMVDSDVAEKLWATSRSLRAQASMA